VVTERLFEIWMVDEDAGAQIRRAAAAPPEVGGERHVREFVLADAK